MFPLPTPSSNKSRVFVHRSGAYDAEIYSFEDVIRVSSMIGDIICIEDDYSIVGGQTILIDLKDVTFAHFIQMQPGIIKKATMLWQDGSPLRQKGLHYINTPPGFDQVFNIFKGFMNEKIKSRVRFTFFLIF
jgi:CRAL/TRIO domain